MKVINLNSYRIKKCKKDLLYFLKYISIKGDFVAHPWQKALLEDLERQYEGGE